MTVIWLMIVLTMYIVGRQHGRSAVTEDQFYHPEKWVVELQKRADYYREAGI